MAKLPSTPFIEPWIDSSGWKTSDFENLETPCYVVSEKRLEQNLEILAHVQKMTGAKILVALKSFSMFSIFPLIRKYLVGSEASSVNEARLGATEFGGEMHTFSPSYTEKNIHDYIKYSDHLVFNSFSQWNRFRETIMRSESVFPAGSGLIRSILKPKIHCMIPAVLIPILELPSRILSPIILVALKDCIFIIFVN